jgi:hypoxanthine phosphoribosyltransferase
VDDVVTSGTTLMAAARRLNETFPKAIVTAFALARVSIQPLIPPERRGLHRRQTSWTMTRGSAGSQLRGLFSAEMSTSRVRLKLTHKMWCLHA